MTYHLRCSKNLPTDGASRAERSVVGSENSCVYAANRAPWQDGMLIKPSRGSFQFFFSAFSIFYCNSGSCYGTAQTFVRETMATHDTQPLVADDTVRCAKSL